MLAYLKLVGLNSQPTSVEQYLIRLLFTVKNLKTKCDGLSPALFLFSIAGNSTYVLSILTLSMDIKHLVANAGWIAGMTLSYRFETQLLTISQEVH